MSGMLALPEGCIAAVISFTSPRDACRLACVSTTFRSAADSDVVWDRFLPPDYLSAISDPGSVSGSSSSSTWLDNSKKELYLHICRCHNLIHNGKMSFWFDLPSGKKCYMISARELNIDDGDDIYSWEWYFIPEAKDRFGIPDCRFPEVVRRAEVNPFEMGGNISTSLLSPMTTYVAYLVFAENRIFPKYYEPVEAAVGIAGSSNGQNRTISFHWEQQDGDYDGVFPEQQDGDYDGFFPKKRADGWLESELGEFFNRGLLGEYQNTQLAGKFKANEVSKGCKVCWENIRIPDWQVSSKPMRLAKAARFVGLGKVFC
ncbi:hypothetical protein LWI29_013464 [Acer saccharum]|uniref:F-box domain-containing protein n=1 Tax=Acer saccharum TaxID=4024 RepID=A0AA39VIU1_ACESA|nr:hypothetical protein LWI29_013464 [Acer saccharum]